MSLPWVLSCATHSQFEVQVRSLSLRAWPLVESGTDKAGIYSFVILRQFLPCAKIHKWGDSLNIEREFRYMALKRITNTYHKKHDSRQLRVTSL